MSKIYFLWDIKHNESMENIIFSTYENAEKLRSRFSSYDRECCEIRSKEVSNKCKCDNYNQTTFIIIKHIENDIKVVTTNNYFGIHNCFGFPINYDIESNFKGYELMTLDYFESNYIVKTR